MFYSSCLFDTYHTYLKNILCFTKTDKVTTLKNNECIVLEITELLNCDLFIDSTSIVSYKGTGLLL